MAFVSAGLNGSNALNQRQYSTGGLEVDAATGKPIKYQGSNNDVVTSTAPVNVVATSGSLATGDLLILGTWANSAWAQGSGGVGAGTPASTLTNTGFATGVPTPTGALSSLSGTRGTYALASATPVYSSQGAVGTVLSTSKLTVDFLGAGVYADLNIDLRMPALTETSRTLNVNNNVPVVQTGSTTDFNLRGGVTGTGSGFAGGLYVSSPACVSTLNNCGVGSFNGFVSGPNAANAGVSYKAGSNTVYGNFGGAATFAQSSSAATAAQNLSDGLNSTISSSMTVRFASPTYFREGGFDSYAAGPPAVYGSYTPGAQTGTSFQAGEGTSINFQGSQFVGVVNTGSQGTLAKATGTSSNFGAVGVPTDSDFIGWGAWAQGRGTNPTASGSGGSGGTGFGGNGSGTSQLIDWVHYIAGTPTPTNQMPVAGTATYGLVGGSTPTAYLNGVTQTGQLVSGTLNVDFGTSKIGVSIATQFGANTVNINVAQAAGNTYNGSAISYYSGGNTFNTNSCGPTQINGFFTGNLAYRAGLVYRTVDSAVGVVNGAAAFQRTSASGLGLPGGGSTCGTMC